MLIFTNKSARPSQSEVEKALADNSHSFNRLLQDCNITEATWKYYSRSSGWTLQCKQDGRNLFYIQITDTGFDVWFTLGHQAKSRAIDLVKAGELKKEILSAREYAEGTSFKVNVATSEHLADVLLLARLKSEVVK